MAFVGHIWQSKEELPVKIPFEMSKISTFKIIYLSEEQKKIYLEKTSNNEMVNFSLLRSPWKTIIVTTWKILTS